MYLITPQYSRKKVARAGEMLIGRIALSGTEEEVLSVVENWRISHQYPMTVMRALVIQATQSIGCNSLVVNRLKRLPTIESKLKAQKNMSLSRMQDIGGVRAIVDNVKEVFDLVEALSEFTPVLESWDVKRADDYINIPKEDGYRGVHLVYQINSVNEELRHYKALQIEVQIRTRLQHIWATAVEVVSILTNQDIKRQIASPDWRRFFQLSSCLFASIEAFPFVPGMPEQLEEVLFELQVLWRKLNVESRLTLFAESIPEAIQGLDDARFFVVKLDILKQIVEVKGFSDSKPAWKMQNEYEMTYRENSQVDVVMVSVLALDDLKNAFPNYFLDTNEFLSIIEKAIDDSYSDPETLIAFRDFDIDDFADSYDDGFQYE